MRELRPLLPDVRLPSVRRRLAEQASHLDPVAEADTLRWIEAVADPPSSGNANRRFAGVAPFCQRAKLAREGRVIPQGGGCQWHPPAPVANPALSQ